MKNEHILAQRLIRTHKNRLPDCVPADGFESFYRYSTVLVSPTYFSTLIQLGSQASYVSSIAARIESAMLAVEKRVT